jgi:hypothetical protein
MLRYLESTGLVVPERSPSGYRRYGEPELREAVERWLAGATVPAEGASEADWIAWEQRKHERLLIA